MHGNGRTSSSGNGAAIIFHKAIKHKQIKRIGNIEIEINIDKL